MQPTRIRRQFIILSVSLNKRVLIARQMLQLEFEPFFNGQRPTTRRFNDDDEVGGGGRAAAAAGDADGWVAFSGAKDGNKIRIDCSACP